MVFNELELSQFFWNCHTGIVTIFQSTCVVLIVHLRHLNLVLRVLGLVGVAVDIDVKTALIGVKTCQNKRI